MANLEETHEAELDAILGELSMLEQKNTDIIRQGRGHSRSNSTISGITNSTISSISTSSESGTGSGSDGGGPLREPRTDSPDNDSAFSDTVSLLSSESSASSGVSSSAHAKNLQLNSTLLQVSTEHNWSICLLPPLNLNFVHLSNEITYIVLIFSVIAPKQPKSIWHYRNLSKLRYVVFLSKHLHKTVLPNRCWSMNE